MTACELLNGLSAAAARTEFTRCCGSEECVPDVRLCPALTKPRFAAKLASARPFGSPAELHEAALRVWWHETPVGGWLQAFAAHPRIGDGSALRARFAATAGWSEGEQQAAMDSASEGVLAQLAAWNERYEAKFGHTFIICATGRPAAEVLAALQARFPSSPHAELAAGAAETESPLVTTARLVAALAALLAASDTKTRLRSVPRAGSVALEGSSTGPTTI
jgi:OHCU decarboxylase